MSALPLLLVALALPAHAAAPPLVTPTPVEDPGHRGLAPWFTALRRAEAGQGVARAVHYGDSTLAADGFAGTLRTRLAARFGDAGPGFVSASFDPQWSVRADAVGTRRGEWGIRTILFGGAGGRYGLGGIVGIARSGASVTVRAPDAAGAPRPMRHLEVWYQAGAGYGTATIGLDGQPIAAESAAAAETGDRRYVLDAPAPFTELRIGATGGPVPFYGVVLETGGPGITWETQAVVGVGSKSFTTFAKEHVGEQLAVRKPDLVVVMLGGNEAGYPILLGDKGAGYVPIYQGALDTIRAGTPDAACLVVTPLDQGYLDVPEPPEGAEADPGSAPADPAATEAPQGTPRARPGMKNLVARQREVALASGCAFWSTWGAMGGEGSALTWATRRGIGTGDYVHVTKAGLTLLGDALSDALLAAYDDWAASAPATR